MSSEKTHVFRFSDLEASKFFGDFGIFFGLKMLLFYPFFQSPSELPGKLVFPVFPSFSFKTERENDLKYKVVQFSFSDSV